MFIFAKRPSVVLSILLCISRTGNMETNGKDKYVLGETTTGKLLIFLLHSWVRVQVGFFPHSIFHTKKSNRTLTTMRNVTVFFWMVTMVTKHGYIMKNAVLWVVAPCGSYVNLRFGGTYRLHLQGRKIRERGTSVCRWLVHTRFTRRHISEDGILHSHRRENLKSYMVTLDYGVMFLLFISYKIA
jgi:hypothetical protein